MAILSVQEISTRYGIRPTGVIHVGAHEGQEIDEYRGMQLKKICLIEANPAHRDRLLALQDRYPEISVDLVAVSDRNGTAELNITTESQSSSLLPLGKHLEIYPNITNTQKISVKTSTLDSMFSSERLSGINVLNIDVQGAEMLVLKGARRVLGSMDIVICEVNFEELYAGCPPIEDIDRFLFDLGFL